LNADERKSSVKTTENSGNIRSSRKAAPPTLSEAERELKEAERNALLMKLAALNKYLGISPRCRTCGADIKA
jgi:hypothetical protein